MKHNNPPSAEGGLKGGERLLLLSALTKLIKVWKDFTHRQVCGSIFDIESVDELQGNHQAELDCIPGRQAVGQTLVAADLITEC
ncbi:hypothetical protein C1Y63_12155 [Corynebacterium sp. 13CS0277]|uniref:hypothetical protein n=1 Tax=Corynebacterium sp. 13CS0277 TaxID=2071994 RepID=UPI000D03B998|nr:hypothetical protein [Corynebacterium sp. 13CS0277]PRQ10317.1 hypothetical protein C1Y63_12155 [Corynebacterium sp. 13CS0277]